MSPCPLLGLITNVILAVYCLQPYNASYCGFKLAPLLTLLSDHVPTNFNSLELYVHSKVMSIYRVIDTDAMDNPYG